MALSERAAAREVVSVGRWVARGSSLRRCSSASNSGVKQAQEGIQGTLTQARKSFQSVLALPGRAIEAVASGPRRATQTVLDTQKAIVMHIEAFWARNVRYLAVGAAAVGAIVLWRAMFRTASLFVNLSHSVAEYSMLLLSLALAGFALLWLQRLYTISPDRVYAMAMRRLNREPGVLEVFGAPLTGTHVRAYVTAGGGLRIKNFRPKLASHRLHLVFPIKGSERRGLVSVNAKKMVSFPTASIKFKLLAIDVADTAGDTQRIYLEGNDRIYGKGSGKGLMRELRDPLLEALTARDQYDEEDDEDNAKLLEERREQERVQAEKEFKAGTY